MLIASGILLGAAITLSLFAPSILPRRVSLITLILMILGASACGVLLFRILSRWESQAERGGDVERAVGQALKGLPDDYHVLHDLDFERFNVDHVVVGPTGIFTIKTKAHAGRISAAGETLLLNDEPFDKPLFDQAWKNAFAIRDVIRDVTGITYKIQPILCSPNAAHIEPPRPIKGVYISRLPFLLRVIQNYYVGPRLLQKEADRPSHLLSLKLPVKSLPRAAKVRAVLRTVLPRSR